MGGLLVGSLLVGRFLVGHLLVGDHLGGGSGWSYHGGGARVRLGFQAAGDVRWMTLAGIAVGSCGAVMSELAEAASRTVESAGDLAR